jgi:hypothetical protein
MTATKPHLRTEKWGKGSSATITMVLSTDLSRQRPLVRSIVGIGRSAFEQAGAWMPEQTDTSKNPSDTAPRVP